MNLNSKTTIFVVNSGVNAKALNNNGCFNLYDWCKKFKPENSTLIDFYIRICIAMMEQKSGYSRIPV